MYTHHGAARQLPIDRETAYVEAMEAVQARLGENATREQLLVSIADKIVNLQSIQDNDMRVLTASPPQAAD